MKILLVDDHVLFREGLALLLRPLVGDSEVLEAGTCEEAVELLAARQDVELVLMDLGLPGMPGLEGIAWLQEARPGLPVVALSSADDQETVLRALAAGAMGYIPKSSSSPVMLSALRLVLSKGIYLPPSAFLSGPQPLLARPDPAGQGHAATAAARVVPGAAGQGGVAGSPAPNVTAEDLGLTPRQAEVLDLVLQGKSAKQIGRDLALAPGTVKSHTTAVLRALNVTTRVQAVIAASKLGWRLTR